MTNIRLTSLRTTAAAIVAVLLGTATTAFGVELVAGPVVVPSGADLVCTAVNRGKKQMNVEYDPVIENNPLPNPQVGTIQPGRTQRIEHGNFLPSESSGFCKFTFKGGRKNLQATASVLAGGVYGQTIQAK